MGSLRSFCLLTSILGLEREFASGMEDSGSWELFHVECGEGIVKNPLQLRGKSPESKSDKLEGKSNSNTADRKSNSNTRGPEKRRAVPRMVCRPQFPLVSLER